MKELVIYSTLGCHLCEIALEICAPHIDELDYNLTIIDISESDELLAAYSQRIPVAYRPDLELELDWPFTREVAYEFLATSI